MRRIQLLELHEQSWFPSSLRDEVTDALQFGLNALRAYAPIAPLLQTAFDATQSRSIVDLCSGGGGPWLHLCRKLHGHLEPFYIFLTDKYPNLAAFELVGAASGNRVAFHRDSVDPRNVPRELTGFRTMFSSFHHFPRDQARVILQNAVDAGQGIGIFEITKRAPSAIALMFPWAFTALLFAPLIRPFRWSRLFWTYVIPLIPFVLLFDGVVSCLRTYTPEELREIVEKLAAIEYQWKVGVHSAAAAQVPITYLIGYPPPHL